MKRALHKLCMALGVALTLSACGGGTEDGYGFEDWGQSGSQQKVVQIRARTGGQDVVPGNAIAIGRSVTLDVPASLVASSVVWTLEQQPQDSASKLENANAAVAALVPDRPGAYRLSVRMKTTDGEASGSLTLVAAGAEPVAVAHEWVNALAGTVQLDGSESVAPLGNAGGALTYLWRLVSVPEGSRFAGLDAAEAAKAVTQFTADVTGLYVFELAVGHSGKTSLPVTVTVNVSDIPMAPTAEVSASARAIERNGTVLLDGGDSWSGNGDELQYRWSISTMPNALKGSGLEPVLENTTGRQARFTAPAAGSYSVALKVYDGVLVSEARRTSIRVTAPEGSSELPVARISLSEQNASGEAEKGSRVELIGSNSYDINGSGNTGLAYEWRLIEAPKGFQLEGTKHSLEGESGYFTPTEFGNYVFELTVRNEGGLASKPVRQTYVAMNGANYAPLAYARVDDPSRNVMVGTTVRLNGSGSSDTDKNSLSYQWTLVDRPDGSHAQVSDPKAATPTLHVDVGGPYVLELVVTDSHGISSRASRLELFAKWKNQAPLVYIRSGSGSMVANQAQVVGDAEQPLVIGKRWSNVPHEVYMQDHAYIKRMEHWNAFGLKAEAYDLDGDAMTYLWRLVKEPEGSQAVPPLPENQCAVGGRWTYERGDYDSWLQEQARLRTWDCLATTFSPTVPGDYEFEFLVGDGTDVTGPVKLKLSAQTREHYPTLLFEDLLQGAGGQSNYTEDISRFVGEGSEIGPRQYLFPYRYKQSGSFPLPSGEVVAGGDTLIKTYRFTASGGDYTIADLAVASPDADFQPRFVGLEDGQVIPKGTSIEFKLLLKSPATLPGRSQLSSISAGLNWSFRIAEKSGWTFSYTPYIY